MWLSLKENKLLEEEALGGRVSWQEALNDKVS